MSIRPFSILVFAVAVLAGAFAVQRSGHAAQTGAGTALPKTMQAVAFDKPGGVEVLTLRTLPVPDVGADEVLIAVHTAGVGVWDADIRKRPAGMVKVRFPYVMGSDGAGTVVATGSAVTTVKVGDAVYSYNWDNPKGGFYADYVAVPVKHVARVPKGMALDQAGALGVSGLTALSGIDDTLRLKSGATLIIYGASGAVGTLAIQLAKVRGVKVLAVASGEDGLALVRRLGADAVVDGRHGDIAAAARAFAPKGADAVLALAGGDALERCIAALHEGGRVAFPNGVENPPKSRGTVTATAYDPPYDAPALERLNRAVEARKFEVPIAAEFPLADAAKAHTRLEAGHVLGKIVLRVR